MKCRRFDLVAVVALILWSAGFGAASGKAQQPTETFSGTLWQVGDSWVKVKANGDKEILK